MRKIDAQAKKNMESIYLKEFLLKTTKYLTHCPINERTYGYSDELGNFHPAKFRTQGDMHFFNTVLEREATCKLHA